MLYNKIQNNTKARYNVIPKFIQWDGVFSEEELSNIAQYCSSIEQHSGTIDGEALSNSMRRSNVSFFTKTQDAAWIFDRINHAIQTVNEQFFNFDLNGYDYIQYSEYDSNQEGKYGFHMDTSLGEESKSEMRKLSMMILLDEPEVDFEGGEFEINQGEIAIEEIEMRKGRIIFFPSFLVHRVKPVTKGIRKSLVVWVTGPKFR